MVVFVVTGITTTCYGLQCQHNARESARLWHLLHSASKYMRIYFTQTGTWFATITSTSDRTQASKVPVMDHLSSIYDIGLHCIYNIKNHATTVWKIVGNWNIYDGQTNYRPFEQHWGSQEPRSLTQVIHIFDVMSALLYTYIWTFKYHYHIYTTWYVGFVWHVIKLNLRD